MNPTNATANDPDVIAFSKALIQHESGGNPTIKGASKEYGLAQWIEPTWNAEATKYLGYVPKWGTAEMTPEIQKAVVASKVADLKNKGYNPAQIAAEHNSGSKDGWENKVGTNKYGVKYDVPAYVKTVTDLYHQMRQESPIQTPQAEQGTPSPYGASFPSNPGTDTPLQSAGKVLGNIPSSALNFGKGILNVLNPVNTFNNIMGISSEIKQISDQNGGSVAAGLEAAAKELPGQLYKGFVPTGADALLNAGAAAIAGNDAMPYLKTAQQAIVEDPIGQIAPFLMGARELASKAGFEAQFDNFVKKGVETVTKPVKSVIGAVTSKAGETARYGVSQATGLNPETVKALIEDPQLYSKKVRESTNRTGVAEKVGKALDDLETSVSDTGSGYSSIRELPISIEVPRDVLMTALKEFKIDIVNGKVKTGAESLPLSTTDVSALQHFVDLYGREKVLTPNSLLNARSALSDLSKYDAAKTGRLQTVARSLRTAYDAVAKEKVPGLSELDAKYSPLKQQFEQLRKDYLKKENGEYVFKDGAVTKIANLDKVGRENILGRLEELVPGISDDIKVLRVIEDIERANGLKVGTYARGVLLGGQLLTGNVIGSIVSALLTSPEIAVPLIRGYGFSKAQIAQILMNLRMMSGETKGLDLDNSDMSVEQMVSKVLGEDFQVGKDVADRKKIIYEGNDLNKRRSEVKLPQRLQELNRNQ